MISENFVYLAVAISLIFSAKYISETIKGRVKPNRATWLMISITPMLALAGELDKGVGIRSLVTFMSGFIPLLIFIASFVNKKSYWKLTNTDYTLAGLSVVGLVLWRLTGEGNLAIVFAILADGFAFAPTIIKAYSFPETEDHIVFVGGAISAIIGLLVLDSWTFADWAFPIYLLIADLTMVYLVGIRQKKHSSH